MGLLEELGELEGLNAGTEAAIGFMVLIDKLVPDPDQPRKHFDEEELQSLAVSIKERGILQALIVRPEVDGRHMIVMGERRWRAAQIAGLCEVPVMVRKNHSSYDQMIENIQRSDFQHTEKAEWICARIEQGEKAADIARGLGQSQAWVSKYASYVHLPPLIRARVDEVGMETAQILRKAWIQGADKTEWFLKTHDEITRRSAKQFLDGLMKAEGLEASLQGDAGSSDDEAGSSDRPDEEAAFLSDECLSGVEEFEALPTGSMDPVGFEGSQTNAEDGGGLSSDDAVVASRLGVPCTESASEGIVTFEVERDPETDVIVVKVSGKTGFELREGERREISVSELV